MNPKTEQKILTMLDVLAVEVGEVRAQVIELRDEISEFRAETSANFNRLERRLDNHETRIVTPENRP